MQARAYYNEHDPEMVQWLRTLIQRGHLAQGDVDAREIEAVQPSDLRGFTHCHFFAGIGGWAYALRLAGWPEDQPIWTASCPCQPFSTVGRGRGTDDARHLWPTVARLIRECRPPVVVGEQVASRAGLRWFDTVSADLEGAGYAVGAADLCAAGVGAPHARPRLYWVGHALSTGREGHAAPGAPTTADRPDPTTGPERVDAARVDAVPLLRRLGVYDPSPAHGRVSVPADRGVDPGPLRPWDRCDVLPCADGWRPVQPGTYPLAHGVPGRVGRLRGYGNAIVPHVAAAFLRAYREVRGDDAGPR